MWPTSASAFEVVQWKHMDDDDRLKIIFYLIVALAIVVVIGIWEKALEPLLAWLGQNVRIE